MTNKSPTPILNQEKLTDIHEALTDAVHETQENEKPMVNFSCRMKEETKRDGMKICNANGTDLSTYLRKCTESLVRDYGGDIQDDKA